MSVYCDTFGFRSIPHSKTFDICLSFVTLRPMVGCGGSCFYMYISVSVVSLSGTNS